MGARVGNGRTIQARQQALNIELTRLQPSQRLVSARSVLWIDIPTGKFYRISIVHVLDLESQFVSLVFASSCIVYNALFCVFSVSP